MSEPLQRVTVVMPVHDGRAFLEQSLPALRRSFEASGQSSADLIVVDDGSDDGSASFARSAGARVLESGGRRLGPAHARNVGVRSALGEIVLFVDCDVVLREDTVALVLEAFTDPTVVAVFGSYDTRPPFRGFASQYMNLRHYHVHQRPSEHASTFWSGLGAVRRAAFLDAGGFDSRRFRRPSIEDIDLAPRLRRSGRIRRVPGIQGTHLKRWTFGQVVRTDVLERALPWAELMLKHPGEFDDLNVSGIERLRAVLALLFFVSVGLILANPAFAAAAILLFLLAVVGNRELFALFARCNGPWFALRALGFHQLYYLYGSAAFAWAWVRRVVTPWEPSEIVK